MVEEQITRKTLAALGEVRQLLREHAVELERRKGVKSASTRLEIVNYKTGPMIEGFVQAEMGNGTGLCWCLDVRWTDDSFQVEPTLDSQLQHWAETPRRVPVEVVHDVKRLPMS